MAFSSPLDRLPALLTAAPVTVAAVYVFGSVARGTDSSSSDVDLGVLLVGVSFVHTRRPPVRR
jgi:predicted nucleotidyltransferase